MSDKSPEEKGGLLELIKKLWLPVAGFLGAVTLAYNFYQLWRGDQETVTWFLAGGGSIVLLATLAWISFSYETVVRDAVWPIGDKRKEKQYLYNLSYRISARVFIVIFIALISIFGYSYSRISKTPVVNEAMDANKVIILVAKFDGPEDTYGVRDEIVEKLREANKGYKDIEIIAPEELVTSAQGSAYARKIGESYNADLVLWAWYRPTENPNITIHIENLSPKRFEVINESEIYRPQTTLADLEAFEIQEKLGEEASSLVSFLTGLSRLKSGDYQTALDRFEQVLSQKDNVSSYINPHYLYLYIGYSQDNLGNYQQALQNYNESVKIDPKDSIAFINRGITYRKLKQYDLAIKDYNKAIELDSNNAITYSNRCFVYYNLMQYSQAIQDCDKAIEIDPNYSFAYNNRGIAYLATYNYETAIQDFDKAIALNPQGAAAYSNRGNAVLKLGHPEDAIQYYDKAIALDSKYTVAFYNRGNAFYNMGNFEHAIEDYSMAIKLDPVFADAYNNRGKAYQALGKAAESEADFAKYKELTGKDTP